MVLHIGPAQPQHLAFVTDQLKSLTVDSVTAQKLLYKQLAKLFNLEFGAGTVLNVAVQNRYDTYHWGGAKVCACDTLH